MVLVAILRQRMVDVARIKYGYDLFLSCDNKYAQPSSFGKRRARMNEMANISFVLLRCCVDKSSQLSVIIIWLVANDSLLIFFSELILSRLYLRYFSGSKLSPLIRPVHIRYPPPRRMLRPRPNDAAEAGSVIENLPYFWFHVSNKGVVPTHPVARSSKVVFLHGFMQSHTAWLTTAARIRDKYGHESLLLDFYGHGNSPYPSSFDQLSVGLFVQQLRRTLERVGWQDEKLVFAAISLGAAVALRYNELYPNSAERFLLFAPSTKAEPFPLNLANVASVVAKAGVGAREDNASSWAWNYDETAPIFKKPRISKLNKNTPTYDTPQELKHVHVPFTVLLGQLDCIHTAQAEKWRKAGIPSLNQTIVMPYEFHVTMCHNPARFKLEDIVNAWHCRHLERRRDNNGRKNLRPSNVPTSPPTLDQYKTKNVSSIRSRL